MTRYLNAMNHGDPLDEEGGYYAGAVRYPDGSVRALILSPKNAEFEARWKNSDSWTNETCSPFDGFANSESMSNREHPAAFHCRIYTGGNKTDWYLPARDEWEVIYQNLKHHLTGVYWTSTQNASPYAWCQSPNTQGVSWKTQTQLVRPIRKIFIG